MADIGNICLTHQCRHQQHQRDLH